MTSKVTYFEEVEDDADSAPEGAEKTYARSVAPSSPIKQKANSTRIRGEKTMRRSSAQDPGLTDSDDTVNDPTMAKYERREREKGRDREEPPRRRKKDEHKTADRREKDKSAPKKPSVRPSVKHSKTVPVVHTQQQPDEYRRPRFEDDSSQYGIQPAQAPRPRGMSNRPNSYYGQGTRPPPANERWYAHNTPSPYAPSPMAPSPMQPMPPMPQQSPFTPGMPYAHPQEWAQPGGMSYPAPPSSVNDYFPPPHHHAPPHHAGPPQQAPATQGQAHLAQRFQRPSSAMGHRSISTGSYEHDPYEKENMPRRRSVKIRPAEDDPRQLMPPPPRPKTSQPTRPAVKGPPPRQKPAPRMPPPRQIAQASYDSDTFDDDESLLSQQVVHYDYDDGVVERPRAHRRGSSAYSREGYHMEPAGGRARRHSYIAAADSYPEPKIGSYSEHKMAQHENAAMAYQNGVNGGPSAPLTAAALRAKQSKSSRSSGSSESRGDDSEYRQSATTRTTRSSAIESEDVTIKVTGSAVLKIGGAEIQCQDGGEINITQPSRNGGSDRASTIYSDDRPTRRDSRPLPIRARADSWNRSQVSDYSYVPGGRPPFF